MVPGGAIKEPGEGKGSGAAQNLSHRAFLGMLGTLPHLLKACCSIRAQIHPSHLHQPQRPPPTPARMGRDKLGTTHHSQVKKKGGKVPKRHFHPHKGEFQTQLSPFRKETLVQVTFNVSDGLQVSNSLPVPANPSNAWVQE